MLAKLKGYMSNALLLVLIATGFAVAAGEIQSNPGLRISSYGQLFFSSTSESGSTSDVGIGRTAAGVVCVSDGMSVNANGYLAAAKVGPSATQQHSLPAVSSDTIALIAATQTLTNKTLSAATITGTSVVGGTLDLTTNGGGIIKLSTTATTASTTPALGTTCPASSGTVHWIPVKDQNGTTSYIPCWQ